MIQSQPTGYTRANSFFAPYVPAPPPQVYQRLAESNRIGLASTKTAPKEKLNALQVPVLGKNFLLGGRGQSNSIQLVPFPSSRIN